MKFNRKIFFIVVIVCFLLAVILFAFSLPAFAIGVIIGGIIVGWIMGMALKKDVEKIKQEVENIKAAAEKKKKPNKGEILEKSLINLNSFIRLKEFPDEMIKKIETIVDKLIDLLPKLNQNHPTSNMTIIANNITTDYLPKIVKEFSEMSPENRGKAKSTFSNNVTSMENDIDRMMNHLEKREVDDFEIESEFLQSRFGNKGVSA